MDEEQMRPRRHSDGLNEPAFPPIPGAFFRLLTPLEYASVIEEKAFAQVVKRSVKKLIGENQKMPKKADNARINELCDIIEKAMEDRKVTKASAALDELRQFTA